MTAFLFIISFLLHIILIYAVYSLYQQVQQNKSQEKEEIENILAQFLDELHKENEILATEVKQPPNKRKQIKKEETKREVTHSTVETDDVSSFAPLLHQLIDENRKDVVETSTESKMIEMYEDGETIEEIARKLNRGKTEVELIVKLHRR